MPPRTPPPVTPSSEVSPGLKTVRRVAAVAALRDDHDGQEQHRDEGAGREREHGPQREPHAQVVHDEHDRERERADTHQAGALDASPMWAAQNPFARIPRPR